MMSTTLSIQGMSCQHCVATIKESLEALSGVINAEVSLDQAKAVVEHQPDIDVQELVALVEAEGYTASLA